MNKFSQVLTITTALLVLLTACAGGAMGTEGKTVVVTPAIKGNSAILNAGDKLEVQLPTIPKEGFEWVVQDLDSSILTQEGEAVYKADSSPNAAGGVVTLVFNAVGAGQTTLRLLYASTASNGVPSLSANSFSMVVEVK